ncbi:hypothetical protein Bca4012_065457 [Brassica carinata]
MKLEEHNDQSEATPREIEMLNRLDNLQSQITELHKSREATVGNPELLQEVQTMKGKLDEHSR